MRYLIEVLKFKPENIKKINSISDYPDAFENKDIEEPLSLLPLMLKSSLQSTRARASSKPGSPISLVALVS